MAGEARLGGYRGDAQRGFGQQALGVLNPFPDQVLARRSAISVAKALDEVLRAEAGHTGHVRHTDIVGQAATQQVLDLRALGRVKLAMLRRCARTVSRPASMSPRGPDGALNQTRHASRRCPTK